MEIGILKAGLERLDAAIKDRLPRAFESGARDLSERSSQLDPELVKRVLADQTTLSKATELALRFPEDTNMNMLGFRRAAHQLALRGGHLPKQVMTDRFGLRWIFKATAPGQEYRAIGDRAGSRIFDAIGLETPKVNLTRVPANLVYTHLDGTSVAVSGNGVYGNIQRLLDHSRKSLPTDVTKLTQEQIDQLTVSHVGRTLIFDNDGKASNFLLREDGKVTTIDLGNMYRSITQGPLDRHFAPNPGDAPYYNKLWQGYVEGKLDLNFKKGLEQVSKIEAMSDDEFIRQLRPYVKARYAQGDIPAGLPSVESFLRMALERKHNMRALVSDFYDRLAKERGLGGLPEALKQSSR